MNKLTTIYYTFFILFFLLTPWLIQSMKYNYAQLALNAEEYNNSNPIFLLPYDAFGCLVSQYVAPDDNPVIVLAQSITMLIKLSTICRKFNTLLTVEAIGNIYKHYDQDHKNWTLEHVRDDMHNFNYRSKRPLILSLICAGADQKYCPYLLEEAVVLNDVHFAEILFKYQPNPNPNVKIEKRGPLWFLNNPNAKGVERKPLFLEIKKRKMAQVFIDNGLDIQRIMSDGSNILWHIMDNIYSADLVRFCLEHGIDATEICPSMEGCLLHTFAYTKYLGGIRNLQNFLKKAELLLNVIPHMTNLLNKYSQTPMDIAEVSVKIAKKDKDESATLAFKALIKLLQEHGGFTFKGIKKQEKLNIKRFKNSSSF